MNYYIKHKIRKVNQPDLHIGKISHGYEFCFMAHEECSFYNTPQLKTKEEWFEFMFLNDDLIYNEEDKPVSFIVMAKLINDAQGQDNINIYDKLSEEGNVYTYFKDKDDFAFDTTEFS